MKRTGKDVSLHDDKRHKVSISDLTHLNKLVEECKKTNGMNEKVALIKKLGEPIQELLRIIHDKLIKFNIRQASIVKYEKNCLKKGKSITKSDQTDLFPLLQSLQNGEYTGDKACFQCLSLVNTVPEYKELIFNAINKNLKCKISASSVNKAFPGLIKEFKCALSIDAEKQLNWYKKNKGTFWCSEKIDGNRCIVKCSAGNVQFYSRSGNQFPLSIPFLPYFKEQLKHIAEKKVKQEHSKYWPSDFMETFYLDGEMVVMETKMIEKCDEQGNVIVEDGKIQFQEGEISHFSLTSSIMNPNARDDGVRGKNALKMHDKQFLCYKVFDIIPEGVFDGLDKGPKLMDRRVILEHYIPFGKQIRLLEMTLDEDALWAKAVKNGWEGIMLRLDDVYKGKKDKDMLKRKMKEDQEYRIVKATNSMQTVPGSCEQALALEHVGIMHKNEKTGKECLVWVGSGFDWDERVALAGKIDSLIGREMTVIHNGESVDRDGNVSLRHPRKKIIFWGKGRPDKPVLF